MENWIQTNLNELCEINMGQSPPSSTYNEDGIGLPFFQGKAEFTELHPIATKWCSRPNKIAENNDILISVRAPVGATNIANQKCCIGRGLAAISYTECNMYVFYYLRLIEKALDKKGTGTTFRAISGQVLRNETIPIAPLPEQRAIVAKIERLFSELDDGIASLKKAQEQLKIYRQAVLKKAFEGELTKQWRESQTNLPTAQELLDQIKKEREDAAKTNGKNKPIKPLTESKLTTLPKLPHGWAWVKIGDFAESMKNGIYKPANFYSPSGIPCLRMYNIENGKIQWFDIKRMVLTKEEKKEYELRPGDLLVNRVNSRELVGKTAVIPEKIEFSVYESKNIRLRLFSRVESSLVNYWFLLYANKYFNRNAQQTVGMASINQDQVGNFEYPLCCLKEQQQIVQEIETRLSVCDNIEASIKEALFKAKALRQSILKKAFEGKLLDAQELKETRQAPDWVPANQLLNRIKADKTKLKVK